MPAGLVAWAGHALHAPMLVSRVVLDHVPSPHGISFPALHQNPAGQAAHWSALTLPLRPSKKKVALRVGEGGGCDDAYAVVVILSSQPS